MRADVNRGAENAPPCGGHRLAYLAGMPSARVAPLQSWPVFLAVSGVVLTLLFVFLEPAPSQGLSPPMSALFWALHVLVPLAILQAVQSALSGLWRGGWRRPALTILLAGAIGAGLFTPIAVLIDAAFGLADRHPGGALLTRAVLAEEYANIAPPIMLVWLVLNYARLLRLPLDPSPEDHAASATPAPAFWDRVPRKLGRELVALSAELHYLRVYTDQGDALVLYPFGRAVEELSAAQGLRVHRSHWAARAHLVTLQPRGQGGQLVLSTGLRLPVSRSYRADVVAALR